MESVVPLINQWLDTALKCEIIEERFYRMTLPEVKREIEAYSWRYRNNLQEQASLGYSNAQMVAMFVAKAFGSKADLPSIEECYPALFADDDRHKAKEDEKHQALMEAKILAFMNSWNSKYNNSHGGESNG